MTKPWRSARIWRICSRTRLTGRPWKSSLIGDGISLHDCSGKRPRLRTRAFSVLQWVGSFLFSWVLGSRKYPQSLTGGISVCIIRYRPQRLEHHVTPQDVLSRPVEGKIKTPGLFDRGLFRCIISSPNQQRQESATEGAPKAKGGCAFRAFTWSRLRR